MTQQEDGTPPPDIVYEVLRHDGGWAYRLGQTYSEPFPTQQEAQMAARRAAGEQQVPGDSTVIEYEDVNGQWRRERTSGSDRPKAAIVTRPGAASDGASEPQQSE